MTEAPKADASSQSKKSGGNKLLLVVVAGVVVIALGAGGWLWHRHATAAAAAPQAQSSTDTAVKSVMHLENFTVNLQGGGGNGYLRIGIDLGLASEQKEGEKGPAATGRLRDAILTVLGTRTVDELMTPEGKTKLKQDLLKTIMDRVPEIQCQEVYFTEFLVQQ